MPNPRNLPNALFMAKHRSKHHEQVAPLLRLGLPPCEIASVLDLSRNTILRVRYTMKRANQLPPKCVCDKPNGHAGSCFPDFKRNLRQYRTSPRGEN